MSTLLAARVSTSDLTFFAAVRRTAIPAQAPDVWSASDAAVAHRASDIDWP